MKQEQKNIESKNKIMHAAIIEFGTKNYENASLNLICSENNISKGLIYHYFKNKDELYLCCVKKCFDELTLLLKNAKYTAVTFEEAVKEILELRNEFFKNNPYFSNIFFNTILQPPMHLKQEIKHLRIELDTFTMNHYKSVLTHSAIRSGITIDEAIEYLIIFQEMFNAYYQSKAYESSDYNSLIEAHEMNIPKMLNIFLYGIIK